MSQITGGAILARALKSMGVDTAFFLIGGPMNELVLELHRLGVKLIDVRHEQAAAMMAHGYSRVSGKVGVCITASGPATVNAATGVAVALDDCAPVIAIGGSVPTYSRGTGAFEEMDQVALMKPITKQAWQVQSPKVICQFVDMAFRCALSGRPGPVYLDLPADVLFARLDENDICLPTPAIKVGRPAGDEKLVKEVIDILSKAERPIVMAGSGALWSEAGPELQEFVDRTQIPFFTTPLARGLIPEDHALCFSGARSVAWKEADAVLLIGSRTNFIIQHIAPPRFSQDFKLITVNIDAEEIGHNRAVTVGIVGDARTVLRQLIRAARAPFATKSTAQCNWVEKLAKAHARREDEVSSLLNSDEKPIRALTL